MTTGTSEEVIESTRSIEHEQKLALDADGVNSNSFARAISSHPAYVHYSQKQLHIELKTDIKPNLTGYTLFGPEKINYRSSTMYFEKDSSSTGVDDTFSPHYSITFLHLGPKLSGHEGIVHGGLVATLLDELTCGVAFLNFESKRGVTANLNVNYRKPVFVNNYVLVKCEVLKKEGRKCTVKGSVYKVNVEDGDIGGPETIETPENLLTESEVLVIEPKWVEKLARK